MDADDGGRVGGLPPGDGAPARRRLPGQALAYYASRGKTPLVWGGDGAARLGLAGAVSADGYEAVFGPGGARHPLSGERLVSARRPGMELVISAHKSVAELGVIGRTEDMHRIMDAERDATVAYLETVTRNGGGRRGRAAVPTATSGLVYAVTRHSTSRAGDPCPHDHVLVANVIEMLDETGGWKAATTALWREHLHAATQIGRAAAAHRAVELCYGITADAGPSGRLGHWRIAGIGDEILKLHSKRAAEITAAVEERGTDTYRARNTAARSTRAAKRHVPEGELVARWRAELASIGWSVDVLNETVDAAAGSRIAGEPSLAELHRVLAVVLAHDGPLARMKVFSRRHLLVELAPFLYGWEPRLVDAVAARVLADPDVIPLIGVDGAIEPVHALASVIAREEVIAGRIAASLDRTDAPVAAPDRVAAAVADTEAGIGGRLAGEQRRAVEATCSSGRGVELVVGVAGAGKTSMLAAVAAAFEASGCQMLGTATAGQAARTLADGADLRASSTLASLVGRLDRGQLHLDDRSVVILDEAGMTDDIDLARLTTHAQLAGAKLIVVGDHRQLGAVGPGGALAALAARHPDAVHHLTENRRQVDPEEREALEQLRDGDIDRAVDCTRSGAGSVRLSTVTGRWRRRWRGGRPTPPLAPTSPCSPGGGPTSPSSTAGPGRGWPPPGGSPARKWPLTVSVTGPATGSSRSPRTVTPGWSPPNGRSSPQSTSTPPPSWYAPTTAGRSPSPPASSAPTASATPTPPPSTDSRAQPSNGPTSTRMAEGGNAPTWP